MASRMTPTRYGHEFVTRVVESWPLTPSCHGIKVEKPKDFAFKPVQFTFLSLKTAESDSWEDYRSMSLATSPTRPHLEYGVRLSDSPWKQAFQALKAGDEVMVEGPVGHFVLEEQRPAVFVAGGIGITPLKGMIEYATDRGLKIPLRLLYSNRDQAEIAYRRELEELQTANERLTILHTLTREPEDSGWEGRRGRVDRNMLQETAAGLDDAVFYVCGAPGMVEAVASDAAALGVPKERFRYEQFWGY